MNRTTLLQIYLVAGFSLLVVLVWTSTLNASAEGSGTYPPPANGDWVITNETEVNNETIVLNGNLSVQNKGSLTLNDVKLFVNSTFDGEFAINISNDGEFIAKECNISAYDSDLGYNFTVHGNMTINNSDISYVFGEQLTSFNDNPGGIVIYSDNVRISNSSISYNRERVISIINSCPIIDRNRIFDNNYRNIVLDHSDAVIINNIFSSYSRDGGNCGIYLHNYSNGTIANNLLINATIYLEQSSPVIINNTIIEIFRSRSAISIWDFSNPVITGNLIKDSMYGIGIINGCQVLIENNTMINLSKLGIHSSTSRITDIGSDVVIINNTIMNCGSGLDIHEGTAIIRGNNIANNGRVGIELGIPVGPVLISENIVTNNSGYGVWCTGGEPITINKNTIVGNNWSGIQISRDVNVTIIDNLIANNAGDGIGMGGNRHSDVPYILIISNNSISGSIHGISIEGHYSQEIISNKINSIENCEHGIHIMAESSPKITNFTITDTTYGIWIGRGRWSGGENRPEFRNITISNSSYGIWIDDQSHPLIFNSTISDLEYGIYVLSSRLTIDNSSINSKEFDFYLNGSSVVYASNTSFDENRVYLETILDKIILSDREISAPSPSPTTTNETTSEGQEPPVLIFVFILGFTMVMIFYALTEFGQYGILYLLLPLYHRRMNAETLDKNSRQKIHDYIDANPGDHYTIIKIKLNLKNGILIYHLHALEQENLIRSKRDGIYKRFYPEEMDK